MILTTGAGRPIPKPRREEFGVGIEGDIAFIRAYHAYRDEVANAANAAFVEGFQRGIKGKV